MKQYIKRQCSSLNLSGWCARWGRAHTRCYELEVWSRMANYSSIVVHNMFQCLWWHRTSCLSHTPFISFTFIDRLAQSVPVTEDVQQPRSVSTKWIKLCKRVGYLGCHCVFIADPLVELHEWVFCFCLSWTALCLVWDEVKERSTLDHPPFKYWHHLFNHFFNLCTSFEDFRRILIICIMSYLQFLCLSRCLHTCFCRPSFCVCVHDFQPPVYFLSWPVSVWLALR